MDGLTLRVEDCNQQPDGTLRALWDTLQIERQRLEAFLGPEVFGQGVTAPIEIRIDPQADGGKVNWYVENREGSPSCDKLNKGELVLNSLEGRLVSHELVHLLIQPPCLTSRAMQEGHAYAIDSFVHPENPEPEEIRARLDNRGYRPLWQHGWDFNNLMLSHHEYPPIPNQGFESILQYKWARLWKEWENKNPGFLRGFYEKIATLKRKGEIQVDKEAALEIAESVTPGFKKWMLRKGMPLQNLGEDGVHSMRRAIPIGPQETDIIQYKMIQVGGVSVPEGYWALAPQESGPLMSWGLSPSWEGDYVGSVKTYVEDEPRRFFMIVPQEEGNRSVAAWTIGDEKLDY